MKVTIISDLHCDKRIHKGVNESRAWKWLISIVDYHKPDLLLSCGDWGSMGTGINPEEFYELLRKAVVLAIYGNHENMDVLTKLYNVRTDRYLPVLMENGKTYEFGGLKITGVNGIIAKRRKTRKGVPRRTHEEFLEVAKMLEGKNIDVLLIHETPYLPELFPFMRDSFQSRAALEVVRIIKPKLVVNGHMHYGGYRFYEFGFGTKYIYIDPSQQHKHYLVLGNTGNSIRVEVWRDFEKINELEV